MTIADPITFAQKLWPNNTFYREQEDIIRSVWDDDETIVPAGNMLGKDYIAGRIVVLFFLSRQPCRIVTTSAKDDHLRVLWGEIRQAINTSVVPLLREQGGKLICTHREIKKVYEDRICPLSYVRGMVANPDSIASMQGHHIANRGDGIPRTLFMSDESSSVPNPYFDMAKTWANRMMIFGNPWPCSNYFFKAVEGDPSINDPGGDIPRPNGDGFYRKVIQIRAEDSPNIRFALSQQSNGEEPTGEMLLEGVKGWEEYQKNLLMWDEIQQCVSLRAEFYKGGEVRLFTDENLRRSNILAIKLRGKNRKAKSMGVDSAEGGDSTVWYIVDELGVIDILSIKTRDTADIPGQTIAFIKKYHLDPKTVLFDRGGGGKQHADQLRRRGYNVRTVGFGEAATDPGKETKTSLVKPSVKERVDIGEAKYAYKNRRAEMYGLTSDLIASEKGFAIPREHKETMRQLKGLPKKYDGEGRLYLPPKDKPTSTYTGDTIKQILGCSPDEVDALVLAVFGMARKPIKRTAGVI